MIDLLHHDLHLPLYISSSYKPTCDHFAEKYPRMKNLIEETIDYSEAMSEKILVIYYADTTEDAGVEKTNHHCEIFRLDYEHTQQALAYIRSFYPQTVNDLYRNMIGNCDRTGVFTRTMRGQSDLMAACIARRIISFRHMRQLDLLYTDMWMLFNKTYRDRRVILLDLESYKTCDRIEQNFCFYQIA